MRQRRRIFALAALAACGTFALYLPALRNGFVNWDDLIYIVNNQHLRSLDWPLLRWAFTDLSVSYWHPLAWLSHAVDVALWGLRPAGHHLTSIVLHAANTFLVVLLIRRLLDAANRVAVASGRPPRLDDRAVAIAACVTGMLFGIHPLHVESAAWIAERKDLLCALFTLLSVLAYAAYAGDGQRAVRDPGLAAAVRSRRYLLSLAWFVLALLSKPMAVTVPAVLLVLDWHPFGRIRSPRSFAQACGEKLPFLAFGLAASVVAVVGQKTSMVPLEGFPLFARILLAARSLVVYLGKMALPLHLVPLYPDPEITTAYSFANVGALVLVAAITAGCLMMSARQRTPAAVWAYYAITLLPVIGLVRVGITATADRFTYLPSLGPFLLVGLAAARSRLWAVALDRGRRLAAWSLAIIAICLIALLSIATARQIAVWHDSITLWDAVIASEPTRVPLAYNNRGDALREAGQLDRAVEDYTTTIALEPSFAAMSYVNRGIAFERLGELDRALSDFSAALDLEPRFVNALISRGFVLVETGRLSEGIKDLDAAIRLAPSSADAFLNRGVAHERTGRYDRALEDYSRAVELGPRDSLAHYDRGRVLGALGRIPEAVGDLTEALALDPGMIAAYLDRGDLYRRTGDGVRALEDYRQACDRGSQDGCAAAASRTTK